MQYKHTQNKGYVVISVIVFASVFAIIVGGLVGFIFVQSSSQRIKENRQRAIEIAESGLDFYKWYLAHFPGTEQTDWQKTYDDPEGGPIGTYEINATAQEWCNIDHWIDIESEGWTFDEPRHKRKVFGRHAKPTVAQYAQIINSNVWLNATATGPVHSNGGVHMEGLNLSTVTSAIQNWSCTPAFGCSPTTTVQGVHSSSTQQGETLWDFPVPNISFSFLLDTIKDAAQNQGGYYLDRAGSGNRGYHLILNGDGTFDLNFVTGRTFEWGEHIDNPGVLVQDQYVITSETPSLDNQPIPADCPVIYVRDRLWLEGVVEGKLTIAAAMVTSASIKPDVYISDSLTYQEGGEEDGLTVLAEGGIHIVPDAPDSLELNGVFGAESGYVGMNNYSNASKTDFVLNGSVISNYPFVVGWDCPGPSCSGYPTSTQTYDQAISLKPPPYTPLTSSDSKFIEWREVEE